MTQGVRRFSSTVTNSSAIDVNSSEFEDESKKPKVVFENPKTYPYRPLLKNIVIRGQEDSVYLSSLSKLLDIPLGDLALSLMEPIKDLSKLEKHSISRDEAELIALEHGYRLLSERADRKSFPQRSPIVTIMGHVDHGKTTLLDSFRNSNIADGEFGGITQKIGAFVVTTKSGKTITFIDTPGHEAFTNLRTRGVQCTDIVVLVVSAADGVQPQTMESLRIATAANVPVIIAINKIDVSGADPEETERELFDAGVQIEPLGGNIPVLHISAKARKNLDLLEDLILFQSELMELHENDTCPADGFVLEAKRIGDAKMCSVIVKKGRLAVNDVVLAGRQYGKIRQIKDDKGQVINEIKPGFAAEILGLKELPESGDVFYVVRDERNARILHQRFNKKATHSEEEMVSKGNIKVKFENRKERQKFHSGDQTFLVQKYEESANVIRDELSTLESIEDKTPQDIARIEEIKEELKNYEKFKQEIIETEHPDSLNLIVKAQDKGTLETLVQQVTKLISSKGAESKVMIISQGIGQITESDLTEAKLFKGKILTMDVALPSELTGLAKTQKVEVRTHKIIYSFIDDLRALIDKLEKVQEVKESPTIATAVIQKIYEIKVSKNYTKKVAGSLVKTGTLNKKHLCRVIRGGKVVAKDLTLSSLKHFKDEVNEIKKGSECGLSFIEFSEVRAGDIIESYQI